MKASFRRFTRRHKNQEIEKRTGMMGMKKNHGEAAAGTGAISRFRAATESRAFCSNARAGFTLVELVATILVLTFVVLLGLPTLVRAKQRSKEAACQANLRQLGFALQTYVEANNGQLPGPIGLLVQASYVRDSTNQLAWYLADRLGYPSASSRPTVIPQLLCPGKEADGKSSVSLFRTDYVLNDGRELGGPPFGKPGAGLTQPLTLLAVTAITSPGNCAAVADADKGNVNPTLSGWTALPYQAVHGKIRNQLYFDWHVASKPW